MEILVTERETARILQVSVQLVRKWRANGPGPRSIKLGMCVRYRPADSEEFISSQLKNVGQIPKEAQ